MKFTLVASLLLLLNTICFAASLQSLFQSLQPKTTLKFTSQQLDSITTNSVSAKSNSPFGFTPQQLDVSATNSIITNPNIASGSYSVGKLYTFSLQLRDSTNVAVTPNSVPNDETADTILRFYPTPTDTSILPTSSITTSSAMGTGTATDTVLLTVEFKRVIEYQLICQISNDHGQTWTDCAQNTWKQTVRVGDESVTSSSLVSSSSCGTNSVPCNFVTSTQSLLTINTVDKYGNPRTVRNINDAWVVQISCAAISLAVDLPCSGSASVSNRLLNSGSKCDWNDVSKTYIVTLNFADTTANLSLITLRLVDSKQTAVSQSVLSATTSLKPIDSNTSCNTWCKHKAAILGGTLGGLCALIIIIAVLVYCLTRGTLSKKKSDVEMS